MNHGFFEAQRAAEANLEKSQVDPGDECSLEISYLEHTPIGGTAEVELQFDVDDERQPGTARRTDDDAGHLVSGTGSLTEESADDLPLGMRYGPGVLEMDTLGNLHDDSGGAISPSLNWSVGSPGALQGISKTLSLESARSMDKNATYKSTEGSLVSKETLVSLANLQKQSISEHLVQCKSVAFKQRIRTSGTLCSLGLLFVICGVAVVLGVPYESSIQGHVVRASAVAFLLFGLVSFLLALLPTDQRAVPVSASVFFGMLLLFGGVSIRLGMMYVLLAQADSEASTYVKGLSIAISGVFFVLLAFYLCVEACRPRRNKRLLKRMWYCAQLFFAIVAYLASMEAFVDFTEYGPAGFAWFIATAAAIICTLTARSKDFRSKIQSCLGTRGESAGSAAAVAALVGSNSVKEVLDLARSSFFTVKADRLKMEHMASSAPDPSLSSEKLTRRTRLGEADAFISHSWSDDPAAKWNAIQGWRKRFMRQHHTEPRLWIDKYCIDQSDFKNSLACLPIYLASCSKMVVICGESYLTRLWCVIELFVFLEMGGSLENLEVIILPDPEHRIADRILDFDPCNLQCNSKAETADVLQSVLEAGQGGLDRLRDLVRQHFAPKATARKRKGSKGVESKNLCRDPLRRLTEEQENIFSI